MGQGHHSIPGAIGKILRKTVLLLASVALAVLLAGGLAAAQSTSEVTTYYKAVDKWGTEGSANGQFAWPVA
jgi:hypothetical protein